LIKQHRCIFQQYRLILISIILASIPIQTEVSCNITTFSTDLTGEACEIGLDLPIALTASTYLSCEKAASNEKATEDNRGVWKKKECPKNMVFNMLMRQCQDHEMKSMLDDLAFCKESSSGDISKETDNSELKCNVEKSILLYDIHDMMIYYSCEQLFENSKCGTWKLEFCKKSMIFNATLQQCVEKNEETNDRDKSLRQGMMPYIPQYNSPYTVNPYAYVYAYPSTYGYANYGYMPYMPYLSVPQGLPFAYGTYPGGSTTIPMQALMQYYAMGLPYFAGRPGAGAPAPPAAPNAPAGGAPGGGAPGGGAPAGGAPGGGGGLLDGIKDKIPGGGSLPKVPGLDKVPGVGGLLGKLG
ncbi:hypothetical protein T09_5186, partial [Trichinella sp. T9]